MTATQRKLSERKSDRAIKTRDRLLKTAIRLFAQHGIQGVSLRTVMEAAGARNTGAVYYHFGNRKALLEAALDCVIGAMMEEVSTNEAAALGFVFPFQLDFEEVPDLRSLLAVALLPVLTLPSRKIWGSDGIKLLARIIMGEAEELAPTLEMKTISDSQELMRWLKICLPEISDDTLKMRIDFAYVNIICGTASLPYLTALERAGFGKVQSESELAVQLIDYVAGGLTAPAS